LVAGAGAIRSSAGRQRPARLERIASSTFLCVFPRRGFRKKSTTTNGFFSACIRFLRLPGGDVAGPQAELARHVHFLNAARGNTTSLAGGLNTAARLVLERLFQENAHEVLCLGAIDEPLVAHAGRRRALRAADCPVSVDRFARLMS
jgi:hypothetical protein